MVLDQSSALIALPPVVRGTAYVQSAGGGTQLSHSYLADAADCLEFGGTAQAASAVSAPATATTLDDFGVIAPFTVH